jgi:hypothetical protein
MERDKHLLYIRYYQKKLLDLSNSLQYVIFRSRYFHCVAVLGDVLYVMVGYDGNSILNRAERYDPKTDRWSLIADMNVGRQFANATALNGNRTILKQEGIRTNCVPK